MTITQEPSRVALITGAASGIGRRIAEGLAIQRGISVYIVDKDAGAASEVALAISAAGGRAKSCVVDLRDCAALQKALPELTAEFGVPDIVVNNAAMAALMPAAEYSLDHWTATMAVNVTAPMILIQHTLPHMKKRGWGRIVNVASISGIRAGTGRLGYGTSKAALIALTRQFAIEVAEWGITVNAVAPGPVETPLVKINHDSATRATYDDMVPMRRYGTPEEIANGVLFLASDQASYVTGHTLAIDGGFIAAGVLVRDMFEKQPVPPIPAAASLATVAP
ncbi:SDR family NAD(P)-dependent oxidoreductase [Caenimonas soli]|uniref:SDR family NAD(P)-dependent oxidoreductase n=1 Tax=Caenimonas soli TaxID=2735555 RepID=UPI00155700F8|nr:SDR family NAD(P)-dependent oxidoreductase [Caenimonas soli]NPC57313.1 SDR family oxidoreductase [Caenimonas soli]